jgi:hypothetical protein
MRQTFYQKNPLAMDINVLHMHYVKKMTDREIAEHLIDELYIKLCSKFADFNIEEKNNVKTIFVKYNMTTVKIRTAYSYKELHIETVLVNIMPTNFDKAGYPLFNSHIKQPMSYYAYSVYPNFYPYDLSLDVNNPYEHLVRLFMGQVGLILSLFNQGAL